MTQGLLLLRQRIPLILLLSLSLLLQLPQPVHCSSNSNETEGELGQEIRGGYPIGPLPYFGVFAESSTVCGAALIHGDLAITAAHCVNNAYPGALRFNSDRRTSGGTVVGVRGRIFHPGWTGSITSADLAILLLDAFVSLTPVTLNGNGAVPANEGELMFAMGFGLTSDNSGVSNVLLATDIPHKTDCESILGANFVSSRMICGDSTQKATCGGDSGSPVMRPGTNIQIGVNSFSNGGCQAQSVDSYTRVSAYYNWIRQQICANSAIPPDYCLSTPNPTPGPTPGSAPAPAPQPTIGSGSSSSSCIFGIFSLTGNVRTAMFNFWHGLEQSATEYFGGDQEP